MTLFTRYRTAEDIPEDSLKDNVELKGVALTISDGDGIRFYHVPFFSCSPPNVPRQDVPANTIRIRLAGIDAPEMAHDTQPGQPYAQEAKDYLSSLLKGQKVTVRLHGRDQYSRVIASVYTQRCLLFRRNASLAMVEAGLATVYHAAGAEYGGIREKLVAAEQRARQRHKGIWKQNKAQYESPADYKRRQKAHV